jgi:hypothetical protein
MSRIDNIFTSRQMQGVNKGAITGQAAFLASLFGVAV